MLLRPLFSVFAPPGSAGRLSILIFHRVLPEQDPLFPDEPDVVRFDQVMGWVAGWLNVLPLDEAVRRLQDGTLPARAAAITFDDGYADNYTHAMPVLRKHGLSATFFVASGFLDGGRMWNDTLIEAVRATRCEVLDSGVDGLSALPVADLQGKRDAVRSLISAVKHLPPEARARAVAQVAERCDAELPDNLMMTSAQLLKLRHSGMLIGAHTVSHPILAASSHDEALREISESKARLEEILHEPIRLFAYPNGKPGQDYLPEHVEMVRELGFDAAVSTLWGANSKESDPFQLLRFTPWGQSRLRFGARMLENLRRPTRIAR